MALWKIPMWLLQLLVLAFLAKPYSVMSQKVVGGQDAVLGQFPFQLQLELDGLHYCGANLVRLPIMENYLFAITAAHCVFLDDYNTVPVPIEQFLLTGGSIDRHKPEQTVELVKYIVHPDFNNDTYENDVAILFLKTPFTLTDNLKPIELNALRNFQGKVTVSGWGRIDKVEGSPCEQEPPTDTGPGWGSHIQNKTADNLKPPILKYVDLYIFPFEECIKKMLTVTCNVYRSMICAGGGDSDTCNGDSGGPMSAIVDGKQILVGLTSWGYGKITHNNLI